MRATAHSEDSGVTTRGEVKQLPQGAKWQGALWADGLFALLLNFQRQKDVNTFTASRRFYRAMHFSAKRGIAIACRLSVSLSVCNVGGL